MDKIARTIVPSEEDTGIRSQATTPGQSPTGAAEDLVLSLSGKEEKLRRLIYEATGREGGARALVAFSGGVDSSLLLWESAQALGSARVLAVTATSATSVPEEEQAARQFAALLSVQHVIVSSGECEDPAFASNPQDRCYVCKRIRYQSLQELAGRLHPAVVLDGTQADDDPGDRPGMRALAELGIRSPLREAGIGKEEVRALLRRGGFELLAEKKAQPCLATRIPFGARITPEALETVRRGERLLRETGLQTLRLRHHGDWARIVTDVAGMRKILGDEELRDSIVDGIKQLGFRYVTLDLEPYNRT
jgi:pyridinium-3,5-biscarboxylic acid mononucleotide sulfurtransferase